MLQIDSSLTVMEQTTVDVLADREFMLAWEANIERADGYEYGRHPERNDKRV